MAEVLRASGLGHSFDGTIWQFSDLDVTLEAGGITAVLGPNGRGKSTLLRTLAGLSPATRGTVTRDRPVAYVAQDVARPWSYSVFDVVLMGCARSVGMFRMPGQAERRRAAAALERVGLPDLAGRPFDRLSGGQRQMVLIARAIASQPGVLLLDEPTSALDLRNQGRMLKLIASLAGEGLGIMLTTHQPDHALALADQVLLMLPDGAVRTGPARQMLGEAPLQETFGVQMRRVGFEDAARHRETIVPLFD